VQVNRNENSTETTAFSAAMQDAGRTHASTANAPLMELVIDVLVETACWELAEASVIAKSSSLLATEAIWARDRMPVPQE
jgi:hypothetical protein